MQTSDTRKSYKTGDIIMRQGDEGHAAFIIEEGKIEIQIEKSDGDVQIVGTRGAGTMIGEMALVDNAPRTATIKVIEDCKLLEITKEDFSRRLETADPVLRMTAQVILTRYRDTLARADIIGDRQSWPPPEAVELGYAEKADAVHNIKLANDLKDAIGTDQLTLNYQPIVNLQTGLIVGFESLMRWTHPKDGFISPGVFIPVAEDTGLIVEASNWGLKEACSALKRIENEIEPKNDLFMSVNFSSTDFASDDFAQTVKATLDDSLIKTEQLHLEITERLLMNQPDNARAVLKSLRDAGMGISIDDFGTGYSSLSYLHYFPINTLKIDQSFTRDMMKNENSMELVKSIISLAQNLGMHVIAEGVESEEEGVMLKDLGCNMAQGYFYARPAPEAETMELIKNWTPVH